MVRGWCPSAKPVRAGEMKAIDYGGWDRGLNAIHCRIGWSEWMRASLSLMNVVPIRSRRLLYHFRLLAVAFLGVVLIAARSPMVTFKQVLGYCLNLYTSDPNHELACVKAHGYDMKWKPGACSIFNSRTPAYCLRPLKSSN